MALSGGSLAGSQRDAYLAGTGESEAPPMAYGTEKHQFGRSEILADRVFDGLAVRFALEPIAMGCCFGMVVGALANSGVVLYAATIVGWAFGFYLRRRLDV